MWKAAGIGTVALIFTSLTVSARASGPADPSDPAELGVFLAGLLPSLMATHHVPGAVFVMVKDGDVFFARGYGYADLETRRPVDPETTLLRVASASATEPIGEPYPESLEASL
jgi:CubicO group peptidase (beta-lactamase class C family)